MADASLAGSGIYCIRNTVNGKAYIGSAVTLRKRRDKHFGELRKGLHHSLKLQRSWDKHGEKNFSFRPLLICARKDLLFYEQRAISVFQSVRSGYNMLPTAGSRLGAKHTDAAKQKVSAAKRGVKRATFSDEWLASMSAAHIGKRGCLGYKHTEEARANMRARVVTDAHRAALSESLRGNSRARGFKHSDETKAKVSAAGMGNTNMLGKKLSEGWKERIGAAQRGKPKPPEQRAKMAESARRAWIERRTR